MSLLLTSMQQSGTIHASVGNIFYMAVRLSAPERFIRSSSAPLHGAHIIVHVLQIHYTDELLEHWFRSSKAYRLLYSYTFQVSTTAMVGVDHFRL